MNIPGWTNWTYDNKCSVLEWGAWIITYSASWTWQLISWCPIFWGKQGICQEVMDNCLDGSFVWKFDSLNPPKMSSMDIDTASSADVITGCMRKSSCHPLLLFPQSMNRWQLKLSNSHSFPFFGKDQNCPKNTWVFSWELGHIDSAFGSSC